MNHYIVVIGTSAGGLSALTALLSVLPEDFPAPILVVMHMGSKNTSNLATLLQRRTKLTVQIPTDSQEPKKGNVYVSVPNLHMVIENETIRLIHGPKINHCRPAIDPLFYSAATYYGKCAIGIILSGLLDDGSAGLLAIKQNRGMTIVQEPNEAEYPDMPENALRNLEVDYCLPINEIALLLTEVVKRPPPSFESHIKQNSLFDVEMSLNKSSDILEEQMNKIGKPSSFACPTCHGVLWEIPDDHVPRFRCRLGHGYTITSLVDIMDESTENSVWAALRAFEENEHLTALIVNRLIKQKEKQGSDMQFFLHKVDQLRKQISTLRTLLNEK